MCMQAKKRGNSFATSYWQAGVHPLPGKQDSSCPWFLGKTNIITQNISSPSLPQPLLLSMTPNVLALSPLSYLCTPRPLASRAA